MENDTSTAVMEPPKTIEQRGNDLHLVAETPAEMGECHASLKEWCKWKIATVKAEADELKGAYEHAEAKKWKTSVLKRHWQLAEKRLTYYEKIFQALDHGYYIVPNFPVEIFAIRTDKENLKGHPVTYWSTFEQKSKTLPQGEGEYKNPFPLVRRGPITEKDDKTGAYVTKDKQWPDEWQELEFPINMSKPQIMKTTDRAMALKLFDEIGILPKSRKEDPLIVGLIKLKTGPYAHKTVTFILSWHLNTRDL